MARINSGNRIPSEKKKTQQGKGKYSKKPVSGGETFHGGKRAGSPPSPSEEEHRLYEDWLEEKKEKKEEADDVKERVVVLDI